MVQAWFAAGALGLVLATIALLGGFMWFVLTRLGTRIDRLETSHQTVALEMATLSGRFDGLSGRFDDFDGRLGRVEDRLGGVEDRLGRAEQRQRDDHGEVLSRLDGLADSLAHHKHAA